MPSLLRIAYAIALAVAMAAPVFGQSIVVPNRNALSRETIHPGRLRRWVPCGSRW